MPIDGDSCLYIDDRGLQQHLPNRASNVFHISMGRRDLDAESFLNVPSENVTVHQPADMPPLLRQAKAAGFAEELPEGCCCSPLGSIPRPGRMDLPPLVSMCRQAMPARVVPLPPGRALVGTQAPLIEVDGEGPARTVRIGHVAIDPYAVTNDWFAAFVGETGYVTDAERFGWSFVFHAFVPSEVGPTEGVAGAPWWRRINGADWRHPEGPGSHIDERGNHPAVQISLNDARAFAVWAGGRLPNEAEWEHAARGGLGDVRYPWGDEAPDDRDFMPCNIWQGDFPHRNTGADGWLSTCPVNEFAPNGFGLYNMCGNTWEWCEQPLRIRSNKRKLRVADASAVERQLFLTKGGSHLCHRSYCHRYRIAARTGNSADSATGHIGFRIVYDI